MKVPTRRTIVARRLAITSAALVGTALTPLPAFAQDSTWNGATAVYNSSGNWTPATVPTNRGTLANTGQTTVAVTADASINEILFAANAQQYEFVNAANFTVNGIGTGGFTNASALLQTITNNNMLTFNNNATVTGGTGGILIRSQSNAGSSPVLIFNNNSGIDANVDLLSLGGSASAVGVTQVGSNASVLFNDSSHADGASLSFSGGNGGGQGGVGVAGTGVGGTQTTTFNATSHADGATIANNAGAGIAVGGSGSLATGVGIGGSATLTFNDASHVDNAAIQNREGVATAVGGVEGASATAVGGVAILAFNSSSHADNGTMTNGAGGVTAVGGFGAPGTPLGTASVGGTAVGVAGIATITFNDTSHADGTDFINGNSGITAVAGNGGPGDTGTGGIGGAAVAVGGGESIVFNGASHADGATFVNTAGAITSVAGSGGMGGPGGGNGGLGGASTAAGSVVTLSFAGTAHANGATITNQAAASLAVGGTGGAGNGGIGGDGGIGTATGGQININFSGSTAATGMTITNSAGDATATGGNGGAGGPAAGNGGAGGNGTATGTSTSLVFQGTSSAANAVITNQAGDASATGGQGGLGGGAAGVNGGTGGIADATGGNATMTFQDTASAGTATITNIAGTSTSTIGSGGDGNVGDGGQGGVATAHAGDAIINFNNNATAGTATITNLRSSTPPSANGGTNGAPGGGGGNGGPQGAFASAFAGHAIINFNNNATAGGATITNEGDINFNDSATGGASHLTNQNSGFTRFNDNSIFGTAAGALITNTSGQILFFDMASLGSAALNNVGGTVTFSDNSTAGTGAITNAATGFFRFQNDSTSGSATINNAGDFGYIGNARAGTSVITNSGALGFSGTSDAVFARVINTGTGIVTVDVGALRLGSLSGSGSVIINSTSLQVGYLDLNETFAGVISGGGQLLKRGTGTFVLTGANTYTGTTTITAGTLQIDGSITSNTVIVGGTTLRGIGTITGNITNNGIFNAGNAANPTGTLHVTGNYQGNGNSLFLVNIAGANSNLLQATGSLTLGGSTVRPQAAPGTFFLMQNDYRIAVGGSRNDTFAGIDESLLPSSIDASLFYTSTEAFLRLRRNSTTFAQTAGLTPNQTAVSASLDAAVAANNPLVFTTYLSTYNGLLGLTSAQLPGALNVLSGDALTAVPVAAQDHATRFAHRLDAYTWSNSSNLWGLIAYGDEDADSDGNGPGFGANGLEFQMGFNTSLGANTRVGLSVGYNDGDVDIGERLASADIETWSVGAQLRHDFGQLYASGQLTYSWHSIDSSRTLFLAGTANASYDANTLTAGGELGWVIHSGQLAIEPHVSVRYANTSTDAFSEAGPVGALNVAAADYETTRLGLGLRLANRDPAAPVRFYALVRYEREMGDEQSALDNTLPGLPTFRVVGTHLGDDVLTGDVGVEFRISNGLSLFAAGGGHTRSNETSLNANAGLRIVF